MSRKPFSLPVLFEATINIPDFIFRPENEIFIWFISNFAASRLCWRKSRNLLIVPTSCSCKWGLSRNHSLTSWLRDQISITTSFVSVVQYFNHFQQCIRTANLFPTKRFMFTAKFVLLAKKHLISVPKKAFLSARSGFSLRLLAQSDVIASNDVKNIRKLINIGF